MKIALLLRILVLTVLIYPRVGDAATLFGKVVCIGDSITEGRYAAPEDTGPYSHGKFSWRYQFWKNAVDAGDSYEFVGSRTSNFGGSSIYPTYAGQSFPNRHEAKFGTTTSERAGTLASHYSDLNRNGSNYAADVAIILIGSNDINANSSAAHISSTAALVQNMINGLRSAKDTVDIYIISVLPRYIQPSSENPYGTEPDSARNAKYVLFNNELSGLASNTWTEASRVNYVDANSHVVAEWYYDSTHPNEIVGEIALGDIIYTAASTLGSSPPQPPPPPDYPLPFQETFEPIPVMAGDLGSVHGQNGWEASPTNAALVQDTVVSEGSQACSIDGGRLSRIFTGEEKTATLSFAAQMQPMPMMDPPVDNDSSVAFWLSTNNHLVAYSNTTPVELTSTTLAPGTWATFEVHLDYQTKLWSLKMNGVVVADDFAFFCDTRDHLEEFHFVSTADTGPSYIDNIVATVTTIVGAVIVLR